MFAFRSRVRTRSAAALGAAAAMVATTLVSGGPPASGAPSTDAATGASTTYLVVYREKGSTTGAASAIAKAGGTVVATYAPISVVVAKSSNPAFASTMKADKSVEGAVATTRFASRLKDTVAGAGAPAALTEATWGDTLSGMQWDMTQIKVPQAHAISTGSDDVVVADLDTGLDFEHPDLAPAYDASRSADCSSGTATPLLPGNDVNGHGTHTAGTIAAAANGTGIVGVAPGVKLAGVKTSNDDGFFFPEMVVCAYMWVATHGIDITNNSYFADPWLYNCRNDAEQRAIWTAERRAIKYAQSQGVLVIASQGNDSTDLSHPAIDTISPDTDPNAVPREITNACAVVPVEVPGVVGVTATGSDQLKAYYSSYGISTADVAAPGGDRRFQIPASTGNGRVLSTFPFNCGAQAVVDNGANYCWLQGTSMAGPHAVGVAALIASTTGKTGGALSAALQDAVNPIACPTPAHLASLVDAAGIHYLDFTQMSGAPQSCEGTLEQNSWYGAGEVDALKAVQ